VEIAGNLTRRTSLNLEKNILGGIGKFPRDVLFL
jgi:hypothetical protein